MTRILVIEDEEFVRLNLLELLEAEDFDVVGAPNGLIGALWALEHLPDLIICDVMMPELDGYSVLVSLREDPLTAAIPFIFLTAMADKADLRQGMQLGADDYLTKPFSREELLGTIATRLGKQTVVMQQYTAEHQRAEALQQEVQALQKSSETKDELLNKFQQELRTAVPKLNIAIRILKNLQPGAQRDRAIATLQEACTHEIALLNQIPQLQDFLTPEDSQLLRHFDLVVSGTEETY
ncbi:MAG TPA: response regulator [Candidatus Caenarcaniphilales bacterium]